VRNLVIDTDVASALQKRRAPAWITRELVGARVWLTFVTVGELYKWAEVRSWGERSRRGLDTWIGQRPMIPYDPGIARTWGRLSAAGRLRGRPRPQNDTWIAACCVRHGLPLVTLNTKDFADFADHDGLVLLTDTE
jgi:predicted nucleic acid-binding protein